MVNITKYLLVTRWLQKSLKGHIIRHDEIYDPDFEDEFFEEDEPKINA